MYQGDKSQKTPVIDLYGREYEPWEVGKIEMRYLITIMTYKLLLFNNLSTMHTK